MIRPVLRSIIAAVTSLALLAPNQVALGHTGYPPIPIFTFTNHPDFPMEDFAAGRLGIILPTYNPLFLYAAYRNLTEAKLTPAEITVMKRGWEPLLNIRFNLSTTVQLNQMSWKERWLYLRIHPGEDQQAQAYLERKLYSESYLHKDGHYVFFENCNDDAFRNAVLTLRKREQIFGKKSQPVRSWLAAQDEVFENCGDSGSSSATHIPVPAADSDLLLAREDRAYQIAAAHFYRGDYNDALDGFAAIANDSASPWHGIAPYLVGRTLLRKAQFDAPKGQQFDAKLLDAATAAFRSVIADQTLRLWHAPAQNLLNFIEIRQNPATACSRLATSLPKRGSLSLSAQPLTDYLYLLDENREDSSLGPKVCTGNDDLSDWLKTFSGPDNNKFRHAYKKWRDTKSFHWLIAALVNVLPSDAQSEELLTAAANVPHTSPAYWTAYFYRERLLAQKGRPDIARNELDDALAHTDGLANPLNPSSRNLLLALRARVAADLNDSLRFAVRTPSSLVYMDEYNTKLTDDDKDPRDAYMRQQFALPHFDDDTGAVINNYLCLSQLLAAAQSSSLPFNVRREVVLMALTRAIVTENSALDEKIARAAILDVPDAADDLNAFLAAPNKQQKDFAAVWLILHHPEMQPAIETGTTRATAAGKIDSFQDNWWAHFQFEPAATEQDPNYLYYLHWWDRLPDHLRPVFPEGKVSPPAFASTTDLAAAQRDWQKLELLPPAGDWLATRTLEFAHSHPEDPRIPEALHLAVRATRFGRSGDNTPNYSKQAFQLLHKKYPDSDWAKKTPYWF